MVRIGKHPQSICKSMSKCSSEQLGVPRIDECEVCTMIVDLIKVDIMLGNATVQLIIKAVEALCALIGDVPVYEEVCAFLNLDSCQNWEFSASDVCELVPNNPKYRTNIKLLLSLFSTW